MDLEITDVAFGGEGVGRFEGFVVFVPFVITGEKVEARITEIHKQFARAELFKIIKFKYFFQFISITSQINQTDFKDF